MTGLLAQLRLFDSRQNPFEKLGYLRNPFPNRGEILPEVYVERPELQALQTSFVLFLQNPDAPGAFWTIQGGQGLGKTNFLKHIAEELNQLQGMGGMDQVAHRYLPSQLIGPRHLLPELVGCIGETRVRRFLEEVSSIPQEIRNTDLGRFLEKWRQQQLNQSGNQTEQAVRFLTRWLSGQQTYKKERELFDVWSSERLPPAIVFSYLRILVKQMANMGILNKLVLLLDEFEDVQTHARGERNEYVQSLKGLVNTFNWQNLFLIVAGAETGFAAISEQYPSLAARWRIARLKPLEGSDQAVQLAQAYMEHAHREFCWNRKQKPSPVLRPSKLELEAAFGRLNQSVRTHRDYLASLREFLDREAGL